MKWLIHTVILFTLLGFTPTLAVAIECSYRLNMINMLEKRYGESRVGAGFVVSTSIWEVWRNKETGTWTILESYPNRWTCIRAKGLFWQDDPELPKAERIEYYLTTT